MDRKQPLTIDWPTKYDINLLKNRNTIIVLKSLKEDMQFVYKIVYTGINQIQGAYFYSGFAMKDENGFSNMGSFAIVMPKEGTGHQIIFNPFENISLQPNSTSEQGNITDGGKLTNLVINDKKYTISNAIATINGEALNVSKDFQLQTKAEAEKAHDDILKELSQAMIFKGTLGISGTITELPTAAKENCGDTYKVITNGNYGSLKNVKVGDTVTCAQKGEGVYEWVLIPSGDEPNGTVTNIATGEGLTGGPITTSGIISHADTSSQASIEAADRTYITGVQLDKFGHVTKLTTGKETVVDTNTAHIHTVGDGLIKTGDGGINDVVNYAVDFSKVARASHNHDSVYVKNTMTASVAGVTKADYAAASASYDKSANKIDFNFTFPKGDKGDKGDTGPTGPAGKTPILSVDLATGYLMVE